MSIIACATKGPRVNAREQRLRQEFDRLSVTDPVRKAVELQQQIERLPEGDLRRRPLETLKQTYTATDEWPLYDHLREHFEALDESPDTRARIAARATIELRHRELRVLAARTTTEPDVPFDAMTFPRIDGSTSTQPLSVVIASRALGGDYGWVYPSGLHDRDAIWVRPESPPIPVARLRARARSAAELRTAEIIDSLIAINASTHQAYVNLIEGVSDVNLTVRKPSPNEADLARQRGVVLAFKPIALDALVFMVNARNPIVSLTSDQIRAIYGDERTARSGGAVPLRSIIAGWPVHAVVREPNSGSRELFEELVLQTRVVRRKNEEKLTKEYLAMSMTGPFDIVGVDVDAIGYSVHYYEQYMAISPWTRAIAVDGVPPSRETIAAARYPYVFPIYFVYRQDTDANAPAMQLLRWLQTEQGQAAIRESGYLPAPTSR